MKYSKLLNKRTIKIPINEQELKKFFWSKFNNCYCVLHEDYPKSIFMIYNPNIVRCIKLKKISDKKYTNKYKYIKNNICLFEQDYKNGDFNMDYDEIMQFFHKNYSDDWFDIRTLIHSWFVHNDTFYDLSPFGGGVSTDVTKLLKEVKKVKILAFE